MARIQVEITGSSEGFEESIKRAEDAIVRFRAASIRDLEAVGGAVKEFEGEINALVERMVSDFPRAAAALGKIDEGMLALQKSEAILEEVKEDLREFAPVLTTLTEKEREYIATINALGEASKAEVASRNQAKEAAGRYFDELQAEIKQTMMLEQEMARIEKEADRQQKQILRDTIDARKKAGEALTQQEKAVRGFMGTLRVLRSDIINLTVVFGSIAIVAREAFQFLEAGARAEQTGRAFRNLTGSFGDSARLLQELRDATRGTVTDVSLMSATITSLTGTTGEWKQSLLEATPQLVQIARAAHNLNPVMITTEEAYVRLAQAIKKNEQRYLDELGIKIKLIDAKKAYVAGTDREISSLNAAETTQAFLNEALRVGLIVTGQAADVADNAADKYDRLRTAWTNFTNELGRGLGRGFGDTAGRVLQTMAAETKAMNDLVEARDRGIISEEQFALYYSRYRLYALTVEQLTRIVADAYELVGVRADLARKAHMEFMLSLEGQPLAVQGDTQILETLQRQFYDSNSAVNRYRQALAGLSYEELRRIELTERITQAQYELDTATSDSDILKYALAVAQAKEELKKFEQGTEAARAAQERLKLEIDSINLVLSAGLSGEATKIYEDYLEGLEKIFETLEKNKDLKPVFRNLKIDESLPPLEKLRLAQKGLADEIDRLIKLNGTVLPQQQAQIDLQQKLETTTLRQEAALSRLSAAEYRYNEAVRVLNEELAKPSPAADEVARLTARVDSARASFLSARASVEDYGVKVEHLTGQIGSGAPVIADYTARIEYLKKQYGLTQVEIDQLIAKTIESNKQMAYGFLTQAFTTLGIANTKEGALALVAVAEELGLIDERSAAMARKMLALASAFAAGGINAGQLAVTVKLAVDALNAEEGLTPAMEVAKEKVDAFNDRIQEQKEKRIPELMAEQDKLSDKLYKPRDDSSVAGATEKARSYLETLGDTMATEAAEGSGLYAYSVRLQGLIGEFLALEEAARHAGEAVSWTGPGTERGGPRAAGGAVTRSGAYVVGEMGPEIFIPAISGAVLPNQYLNTGNVSINISGAGDPEAVSRAVIYQLQRRGIIAQGLLR